MAKPKKVEWPSDKVERRSVHTLLAYARNSRIHPDEQVDKIARSMTEFGWTNPVLVDEEGVILAGHGRCLAAAKLGINEVPVMVARGWSEAQKIAYRIWDNESTLQGAWDTDMLKLELTELGKMDYDLALTGFDDMQLVQFMATPNVADPEETPEPPVNPVSRKGDLWLLGKNRLLCGDSTDADDVETSLGGARPQLMVTDPPYGVDYDPDWRNQRMRSDGSPSDGRAIGLVTNDELADWRKAYALFEGDVAYAWSAGLRSTMAVAGLEAAGFEIRAQIIWAKNNIVIGRGHYHFQHEPCWYAVRKGKTGHWQGARDQSTLWEIDKPTKSETGHSTQKPIECMKRPMENNSKTGDWVYDPFIGSGTSIIAAEMIHRKAIGIEVDPAYVDVAVQRWQTYTNQEATLEATGETYAETAQKRSQGALKPQKAPNQRKTAKRAHKPPQAAE